MSTSDLKLSLLERLALVQDAGFLQRLKQIFDKELGAAEDFTPEELDELREIERRRLSGEDKYVSMEEAMRMARQALEK